MRAGAGLANAYGCQPTSIRRLVAIGDAFCTTNPQGGRGVALGLQSATALTDLVRNVQLDDVAAGLDRWGTAELLPWFRDHVEWDAALLAQWAGRPVDPDGPIGLEAVVAAAREFHPDWMSILLPFFAMSVAPTALDPLRAEVRSLVRRAGSLRNLPVRVGTSSPRSSPPPDWRSRSRPDLAPIRPPMGAAPIQVRPGARHLNPPVAKGSAHVGVLPHGTVRPAAEGDRRPILDLVGGPWRGGGHLRPDRLRGAHRDRVRAGVGDRPVRDHRRHRGHRRRDSPSRRRGHGESHRAGRRQHRVRSW